MPIIFVPQPSQNRWIPILFIHIPKCGGSSIESTFQKAGCIIKLHDRFDNSNQEFLKNRMIYKCPSQHFHYSMLDEIIDIRLLNKVFALVRNPYSRLASEFRFVSGRVPGEQKQYPLHEWIQVVFEKYQDNPFIMCNHIRPQVEFISSITTQVYKLENGIKLLVQDVFEKCYKEFGWTMAELGLKKVVLQSENLTRKSLELVMSSEEKRLREDASLSKKIQAFYKEDFESLYPEDLVI